MGSEALYLFGRQLCRFRDSRGHEVEGPGKVAAFALACVVYLGESSLPELAVLTGRRRDSLKSRYLDPLLKAGLLLESGGVYRPVPGLVDALKRHQVLSGVAAAEERQRKRYVQERGAWDAPFLEWMYGPITDPDEPDSPSASKEKPRPTTVRRDSVYPDDEAPTLGLVRRVA